MDWETILAADFGAVVQTDHGSFIRFIGDTPNQLADRLTTIGEQAADAWRIELTGQAPAIDASTIRGRWQRQNIGRKTYRGRESWQ